MWIYGFHPVREALRNRPTDVVQVVVGDRKEGKRVSEVEALCRRSGVSLERVRTRELSQLVAGVHNGFAARLQEGASAPATVDEDLVVLLEDVQDPRNLGALLRVCEGAGVGRVLIRDRGSAPITPTVVKTSAGAAELLSIDRITNSANALAELRKDGFWIYGADGSGEAVWDVDLSGKIVLCVGGEQRGLRRRTRTLCDKLVALPMRGRIGSLNVATATAALLYEAVRQRL